MDEIMKLENKFDLVTASKSKTVFFLPKFLVSISMIELWERFSYYGMKALLVVYLTSFLNLKDADAYTLYFVYSFLGHALSVVGGVIADRILGFEQTVLVGAIIIFMGHCTLAISITSDYFVYLGLSLISVGMGFFKGNMGNILGFFYDSDPDMENGRNSGFTLFYVAVNLGAFISSIACVAWKEYFGTHAAFALAGFGMLICLVILSKNKNLFKEVEEKVLTKEGHKLCQAIDKEILMWQKVLLLIGTITVLLLLATFLKEIIVIEHFVSDLSITAKTFLGLPLLLLVVFSLAYLFFSLGTKQERKHAAVLLIFYFFDATFLMYEVQVGSVFVLFIIRNTRSTILGIYIPGEMSQCIIPLVVMIVGPLVASGLFKCCKNSKYDFLRVLVALLATTLCFLNIYLGCVAADTEGYAAYIYPVLSLVIMSIGQVLISPYVVAKTTELAPKSKRGLFMGISILIASISVLGGIFLAKGFAVPKESSRIESLAIYQKGFLFFTLVNIGVTVFFVVLIPLIMWLLSKPKATIDFAETETLS